LKPLYAADLFCGAGGTSTGMAQACLELGVKVDLLAINHWQIAIDTHTASHPWARHMCASVDHINPRDAVPGGRLHILCASPECTNHSIARGGRPINDQSRATAWHVLKWCQELYIDNVLIENVREFREWGPIAANGKRMKSHKGETFRAFIAALESLGYRVEHRILNAADYGDPTTRERLFILARRGNKPIHWPEPTHSRNGGSELFGSRKPYRTAREVIDWSLENQSIFTRKKPLATTTMARIIAGLQKFNPHLEPFIITLRRHSAPRSMDDPLPVVSAQGTHHGLCEPFMVNMKGKSTARDIDAPLATQTTQAHQYLCEPFVLGQQSCSAPRGVDDPLPTVATAGAISVVEPFVLPLNRPNDQPRSVSDPLRTVTATSSDMGFVEPVLLKVTHGKDDDGRPTTLDIPIPTLTAKNGIGMAEAFIVQSDQTGSKGTCVKSMDDPLGTIVTKANMCLVEPFITKYFGTALANSVNEPLDTVTTKDRFGLVQPEVDGYRLDIRFRMLQPHELARAQGFPDSYKFTGTKSDIVKQIGNAVPVNLAKALILSLLADYSVRSAKKPRLVQLQKAVV
jgi:DNA (cytosine-5)-methyltransferase 1